MIELEIAALDAVAPLQRTSIIDDLEAMIRRDVCVSLRYRVEQRRYKTSPISVMRFIRAEDPPERRAVREAPSSDSSIVREHP
jgi:hypothetical protein